MKKVFVFLCFFALFYVSGFFFFFFVLGCMFYVISTYVFKSEMSSSQLHTTSSYECSFSEINSHNDFFSMQFFVIALTFMLFDMEIVLFLPYVEVFYLSWVSSILASVFLGILMLGLIHELLSNVLL